MIGVPINSRSSLARLISSRLALPARTTRRTASTMPAKSSASLAAKTGGESKNTKPNSCEIDLNAGRALDHSTAPSDEGGLRPAGMKLTPFGFRSLDRGRPNRFGSFCLTEKDFDEPDAAVPPHRRRQRRPRRSPSIKRTVWPAHEAVMAKHRETVVLPSSGAALVTSIELPAASGGANRKSTEKLLIGVGDLRILQHHLREL